VALLALAVRRGFLSREDAWRAGANSRRPRLSSPSPLQLGGAAKLSAIRLAIRGQCAARASDRARFADADHAFFGWPRELRAAI
jgi:hypothetical protein